MQQRNICRVGLIGLAFLIGACNPFAVATPTPFAVLPTFTNVPPTTVLPTATPAPSLPGVPTLPPIPATASPTKPANAPTQVPATAPKRIAFPAGDTSATVQGNLAQNGIDTYVLRAFAGQTLSVNVTSAQAKLLLSISGADGQPYKTMGAGTANFSMTLPTTQDYYIAIATENAAPASYALQVTIPPLATILPEPPASTRISFPPGGTSATMTGTLTTFGLNPYVLRAFAGQTMTVNLTTNPAGKGFLVIYGADGDVLISDHASAQTWSGTLRTTQDYNIHVRTGPDAASYTLQVSIPPLPTVDPRPSPKRISFTPGATTATVQGTITTNVPDVYVLRASAGQVMAVRLAASQGQAILMISGADGTVLVPDRVKSTNSSGNLPFTQDYYIEVIPLVSPTTYSLQVTIPPLNLVPIRIVFQPGSTSSIVQGVVAPNATDRYALRALAGQTMTIKLLSPDNQAVVMVWGSDGQVLIPDQADATNWVSRLPATQDYLIDVWSIANADVGYSLHIDVPPLK